MAKKLIATLADSSLFLREWIANPLRTGAVAPSSPKLAAAMAHWLPSDPKSFVLELGPGTGAVTEALAQKIRDILEPHGNWVQYSYHLGQNQTRGASSFRLRASKIVWFNLPPARVSVFHK